MRRTGIGLLLLLLASCRPPAASPDSPAPSAEIDALDARLRHHEANIAQVEQQARVLGEQWSGVVEVYERTAASYRQARANYERAAVEFGEASATYRTASETWKRAKVKWDIAQKMIEAAARLDARNLAQLQSGGRLLLDRDLDCTPVSTQSWRRRLKKEGVDLTGLDVDHIVPRSKGGADHPLNYQLLDSSTNRSLGATWDLGKCASVGAARCAAAMAVSSVCGDYPGL